MKVMQPIVFLTCLAVSNLAAGAPRSGSMLGHTCAGCHGTLGHSAGDVMPSLAGMNKRYLQKSMLDFRSGARPSTIMGRIARGYSEQEIAAIAAFFSQQDWQQADSAVNRKLVKAGKALHENQCESCHTHGGRKNDEEVPRLAGQWQPYIYIQLRDMHDIDFEGVQPLKMRQRVQKLSQEEIEALSHFYASQQ
jgi:sulfide dehydrogenase cytochrome subunit